MSENKIHILPQLIANQIAAGEVIERPSSIIKECLENSLDAHATRIEVDVFAGGLESIKITDNGEGINKVDLERALQRHATSKIKTSHDLGNINSLGFRGEALASMTSVSRLVLQSRTANEPLAWQVRSDPVQGVELSPCAHEIGTTIEIRELFFNVPARRRFLKSPKTEFQHIVQVFTRLALTNPGVEFILKHNGKLSSHYRAALDNPVVRVESVCGRQFIQHANHIDEDIVGCHLEGWIGVPPYGLRQNSCQYFFVNSRPIRDRLIMQAVRTAFMTHPKMLDGHFPCYVLFLQIPVSEVDVNVHPTKHEVRFVEARLVFEFILQSVKKALLGNAVPLPNPPTPAIASKVQYTSVRASVHDIDVQQEEFACTSTYALLEERNKVYLVDLIEAKFSLLCVYFFDNHATICTKPLVFPERLDLKGVGPEQIERLQDMLKQLAFDVRLDSDTLLILKVPVLFSGDIHALCELFMHREMDIKQYLYHTQAEFSFGGFENGHFKAMVCQWLQTSSQQGVTVLTKTHSKASYA